MTLSNQRVKSGIFYGWIIVAAGVGINCALEGTRYYFGVFFKSLETEFGLSRAATSSVYSAFMVLSVVFALIGGWALDKYGPRRVVSVMAVAGALGLILTGRTTAFWQLFITYALLMSIGTGATYPVIMAVVSRWFKKRRGFALGIAGTGGSLGSIVLAPLATFFITSYSWRTSYMALGAITLVVGLLLATLLRRDPSQIGLGLDGVSIDAVTRESARTSAATDFTLPQAMKTANYWLVLVAWLFLNMCVSMVFTHVVPYATDAGIDQMRAATILSIMGFFGIASRLLTGRVSDSIGRKIPGITWALLQGVALVWLVWAHSLGMLYAFAVVYGLAWGGLGNTVAATVADLFAGRNIGVIMGTYEMAFAAGGAIGPALGGIIFDATSSYEVAFLTGAFTMLVTAFSLGAVRRQSRLALSPL